MESSSYYINLINKYKSVIQQISGLYEYLGTCTSTVEQCKTSMKDTQIAGDTLDQGKLDEITDAVGELRNAFNTIIVECKTKIDENEALYKKALEAEQAAAKKTAEQAKTTSDTTTNA